MIDDVGSGVLTIHGWNGTMARIKAASIKFLKMEFIDEDEVQSMVTELDSEDNVDEALERIVEELDEMEYESEKG